MTDRGVHIHTYITHIQTHRQKYKYTDILTQTRVPRDTSPKLARSTVRREDAAGCRDALIDLLGMSSAMSKCMHRVAHRRGTLHALKLLHRYRWIVPYLLVCLPINGGYPLALDTKWSVKFWIFVCGSSGTTSFIHLFVSWVGCNKRREYCSEELTLQVNLYGGNVLLAVHWISCFLYLLSVVHNTFTFSLTHFCIDEIAGLIGW